MTWKDDLREADEIGGIITIFVVCIIVMLAFLVWVAFMEPTNHVVKPHQTERMAMPFP